MVHVSMYFRLWNWFWGEKGTLTPKNPLNFPRVGKKQKSQQTKSRSFWYAHLFSNVFIKPTGFGNPLLNVFLSQPTFLEAAKRLSGDVKYWQTMPPKLRGFLWLSENEMDVLMYTLPETNVAPENRPLEKEIPIGNHHIFKCYVSFREGIFLFDIFADELMVSWWFGAGWFGFLGSPKGLLLRGIPRIPNHQSKPPISHLLSSTFLDHTWNNPGFEAGQWRSFGVDFVSRV